MKNNHHYLYKFILGFIFGMGLIFSGMIYTEKVQGFLNIFGTWDPSLAFVMLGGILVYSVIFFFFKDKNLLLGYEKNIPSNRMIDKKLFFGSLIFGVGWGLYGYCPGTVLVLVGAFDLGAIYFALSMIVGMYLVIFLEKSRVI